jgi:isopentenyl phosphate kinase
MPAFSRVTTTALISVIAPAASSFFLCRKQSLLTVARCQESEQEIIIVKLGGSAITEKSVFETVKKDKVHVTCTQIATASRLGKRHVIVHGAGSFGHFQARAFGLRDGGDESTWRTGVCQTRSSVLSLSGLVIKSMLDASLPATAVTLFPTSSSHKGRLFSIGSLANIETLLSLGFIPVLHGDVLLDSSKKCSVFSGDKIMLWICEHFHGTFKPKLAVFLTDVAGVYDRPPTEPNAQLIKEIFVDYDGSVSSISLYQ